MNIVGGGDCGSGVDGGCSGGIDGEKRASRTHKPDIVGCVGTRVIPCLHTATESYKAGQACGKEIEDKLDDVFSVFVVLCFISFSLAMWEKQTKVQLKHSL